MINFGHKISAPRDYGDKTPAATLYHKVNADKTELTLTMAVDNSYPIKDTLKADGWHWIIAPWGAMSWCKVLIVALGDEAATAANVRAFLHPIYDFCIAQGIAFNAGNFKDTLYK